MLTIEHIRTLSSCEIKVLFFLGLNQGKLEASQEIIASSLNISSKSVRSALKNLKERKLIYYTPSFTCRKKSVVTLRQPL